MATSNLDTGASGRKRTWLQPLLLAALVGVCGLFYVGQYWSPSSYGIVLDQLRLHNAGLVFGKPRAIRSDEWAVVTPLTQATVSNGFERVNKTSFYHEDLRINYGLPIFDWGLIFKPTMWLYPFVEPARAYSFHWFAVMALFLIGHALLFERLGMGRGGAVLLSIGLYFTGFSQFWWNEKGPVLAFFPWVVWTLLLAKPLALRLLLFFWLSASWLITNFYPPVFLSLAFVGALIVLAFEREWLRPRRLAALLTTTALAGGTAALYLKDYLQQTSATIYPGRRRSDGGSVPGSEWFAQFFPFGPFDWTYESVIGQNICEVGCVGAAFLLMMLCFLDYREWRGWSADRAFKQRGVVLGFGLALMYAWMLLPLPSWVGAPLLWNNVQPERMEYAAGLLLLLIAALFGRIANFVFSPIRIGIYVAVIIAGWIVFKDIKLEDAGSLSLMARRSNDLIVIPILLVALVLARRWAWKPYLTMLGVSAASGALALLYFNPIQSARPIFSRLDTPAMRAIDAEVQMPDKVLAMSGMPGAVLNGLGYASVAHVTAVPALDLWRQRYPSMPEAEFLQVFSRYSHIQLADNQRPESPSADVVRIPIRDFWPNRVDVPDASSPLEPLWLQQGQKIEGQLVIPRAGAMIKAAVFIGTGQGRSDGDLRIRICSVTDASACGTGHGSLAGARDNAYFGMKLEPPLKVAAAGETLQYEIWLSDGKNAMALWTQKPKSGEATALHVDDVPTEASPRFQISFQ